VHPIEGRAQGLGTQHVAFDDFGAHSDTADKKLGAACKAPYAKPSLLQTREQATSNIPRGTGDENQIFLGLQLHALVLASGLFLGNLGD